MRKIFSFFLCGALAIFFSSGKSYSVQQLKSANTAGYDTTRLYNTFIRAKAGKPLTLAYIGGSITAGTAASSESKRWVNLVTDWWKSKFPNITVNMINAGLGGTGSDVGMFRVYNDVLKYNPDFIVIEFSVNDAAGNWATESMEGLVRQILEYPGHPAVMMLMLKQSNGTTAQASHKIVGNHYGIPMVSFADLIDSVVKRDGISLESIFADGLHPLDAGMKYIANFVTEELETVYQNLPGTTDTFTISNNIPSPIISDTYDHTYSYTNKTIIPVFTNGWTNDKSGWSAKTPGNEIVFEVKGNSVALLFSKHDDTSWGSAEVWVDDYSHQTLDAYWTQTWGPATVFALVKDNLPDGKHLLHVKIANTQPEGSNGNYFYLMNVLKAGNIGKVAPIAVPDKGSLKMIKDSIAIINAVKSYDPEGDTLKGTIWSVVSQPEGSNLNLTRLNTDSIKIKPDKAGTFEVGLQVFDNNDTSVVNVIPITVRDVNNKPIANAGNDTIVKINTYFYLDAFRSSDRDNDELTYSWRVIKQPDGSKVSLTYTTKERTPTKVNMEGEYLYGLIVNDGFENSDEDTVKVIASFTAINYPGKKPFEIFPNPTHGSISINFSEKPHSKISIEIISMEGKLFKKIQCSPNLSIMIDLPSIMPAGNYCLKIQSGKNVWTEKFVLQ
jgi:lysophospholipase L1-like esterase